MTATNTPLGAIEMSNLPLLDVGGVSVEPMIAGEVVVLRGTIPPGRAVPLHTHPDPETLYLISGTVQGLVISPSEEADWTRIEPGGSWHVPPNLRHGWRNPADEPAVLIAILQTKRRSSRLLLEPKVALAVASTGLLLSIVPPISSPSNSRHRPAPPSTQPISKHSRPSASPARPPSRDEWPELPALLRGSRTGRRRLVL